ncbi:sugar kinase [Alteraurantiacibacter palmitatis]|uniref:Sugar kinase n=1 Tax=Alteraurantiacibacter palmitatis TaxID=2054628 RepID=A0ABV7E904_9SPHN
MATVAVFGEILLRLAPQAGASLRRAVGLDIHVGGAEANVAVGLAQLGHAARVISTLPASALGEIARRRLAAEGIDLTHTGAGPGRMGLYFHEPAAGPRGGGVLYDRAGSAFALAQAAAYDPASALIGVRHLHISGISPAVSEAGAEATLAMVAAAREGGCTISFDGNFRASLWATSARNPRDVLVPLVAQADLIFGNHRDAALLLGRDLLGESPRAVALALFEAFPQCSLVASTRREVEQGGAQFVGARIDARDDFAEADEVGLPHIVERIGTGDAFATGVLHRWLEDPTDLGGAARAGVALMALKHAMPGDLPDFTPDDLYGAGADIQR